MRKIIIINIFIFALVSIVSAQYGTIHGKIGNKQGSILELVNISVKGKPIGTSSDFNGFYELVIPAEHEVTISFSSIGYLQLDTLILVSKDSKVALNVILKPTHEEIEEIHIEDKEIRKTSLTRLDPRLMSMIPEASGNLEAMIKTLPGVSSNNELSSQYSVRGGNFDENLVYVNGIEIYRPFLIRSGQQEGMSFINPDMVSSVLFSAGGFDARYGDKMSSVLDIKYKQPRGWGGAVSLSLLGSSLSVYGDSKDHRFRHISGFRYKTTKYLLNSLETEGNYDPRFMDFQTSMSYDITHKLKLSFLGNYANNRYKFVPEDRRTKFGTYQEAYELSMYFDGQEIDQFSTYTGALELEYNVHDHLELKLVGSAFRTFEQETFDIQSQYYINAVDKQLGSESFGDSISTLGVGTYLKHARNYLQATVFNIEHKGILEQYKNKWQWGARWQKEIIDDNLTEWKMTDSAGYALPYTDSIVSMEYYIRGNNNLNSNRFNAFLQDTYTFSLDSSELYLTGGIRASYWDLNKELIVSPRINVAYIPNWESDFVFRFSTGYYYQPAFYKEMRVPDSVGSINYNIKSQKSIHFVLGSDYNFRVWNRPFKLVTEVYYKVLQDLITYSVDNVRVIYSGENDADGYAMGLDMKLNGEFVKGVDSWISFSLMKTEENIRGDMKPVYDEDNNVIGEVDPGYVPRPTDQRVNVSVFFQDYLPGNHSYKMHIQINYATGLPFGPPNEPRYKAIGRMKPYKRVDIGFSKVLKSEGKVYPKGHFLHHVKDSWLSLEVFNLLDNNNTISHEWVQDYTGRKYAVENSLTGRRINLKLSVRF